MTGRKAEKDNPLTSSGRTEGAGQPSREALARTPAHKATAHKQGRIQPNKHRKVQLTRSRRKLFGRAAKQDFLEWFAATANLGWSARQAGFNYKTVLRHRMNDAVFAEAYDRALRQGYVRLLGQQLETEIATDAEAPIGIEGDRDAPAMQKMDPDRALALLREHGRYLAGPGAGAGAARKQGRRPRVATNAEVKTELERALKVFERRIGTPKVDDPGSGAA